MAYYDTYNDVQFLDLSGVDEDEKKWILTSLQTCDSCVEGPWSKLHEEHDEIITPQPECLIQTNLNNGMQGLSFEQYSSAPVLISNHVSPISPQIYPQTYQSPIPLYPQAFVPQVQYATPIPVLPGSMVPVNGPPMVPVPIPNVSYGPPVTYATYPPTVQANPVYNIPSKEMPMKVQSAAANNQQQHHSQQSHSVPIQHLVPAHVKCPKPPVVASPTAVSDHVNPSFQHHPSSGGVLMDDTLLTPTPMQVDACIPEQESCLNGIEGHINGETSESNSTIVSDNTSDIIKTPPTVDNPSTANSGGPGMTWASLFNKKSSSNVNPEITDVKSASIAITPDTSSTTLDVTKSSQKSTSYLAKIGDPNYYRLGEVLVNYAPDNKITSLQPRGLINRSNYCYINSILQAMLACPPMYNLLNTLGQNVSVKEYRKHTQIIDNMIKFTNEFHHLPAAQRVGRRTSDKIQKKEPPANINYDRPFEPNWIYKMLNGIRSDSFVVEGRQEDAEEFLGCLLNGLNDEMLELMKLVGPAVKRVEGVQAVPPMDDGYKSDSDWQLIGPKNKGCITRRTEIVRTPISDIFGGHIRSKLHRAGDQITINIQPFYTLQLNIEKVNTVREALEALVCKNQLEGVTSSKTNEEVEAWQHITIEELPLVLVLHLKCFDFKLDGCTKIMKQLEFPVDLKIDTKLLSKTNYQPKEKQYKLFAVVYHEGKEASKGHYLTDAYHVGYASWLRYDDAIVKSIQEEQVLQPQGTRVPYLLFYRRSDTVRNK